MYANLRVNGADPTDLVWLLEQGRIRLPFFSMRTKDHQCIVGYSIFRVYSFFFLLQNRTENNIFAKMKPETHYVSI